MAYDEGLAQRIRERLQSRPGVVEKRMFGGLAFLLRGNMCVGLIGDEMVVRLSPDEYEAALAKPGTRVFDFTGRPMKGWLVVGAEAIDDDDALAGWTETACLYAGSLPAKAPASAKPEPKRKKRRK